MMNVRAKEGQMREVWAKILTPTTAVGRYHATVDCPFCAGEHRHGNVSDGEMRIASCAKSDVPEQNGYKIRILDVGGGV
jgi:hypothetical protein